MVPRPYADIATPTSAPVVDLGAPAGNALSRRRVLQLGAAIAGGAVVAPYGQAWAAGSDKPEKDEVRIGFIPLTDCASVVMASVLGF
ncbi:MAG: twin-arginine translocation signal domain-containing protein, partial [Burkholderiaceae bacterium]